MNDTEFLRVMYGFNEAEQECFLRYLKLQLSLKAQVKINAIKKFHNEKIGVGGVHERIHQQNNCHCRTR